MTFKDATHAHHDGILYEREANSKTVIHVHGSFGNFYQNEFLRVMAETYLAAGINFLTFNLCGHDGLAEGYRHEWDFEYVGGAVTSFEDCIPDIQGAIDFARTFSDKLVLQGHSMGCDRVLHYSLATKSAFDLILLSPCDSYQLQSRWIAPETIESQIARLNGEPRGSDRLDILPAREYGLRQGEWTYPIHVSRRTLLSILSSPAFQLMRLDHPAKFYLEQRIIIYIGGDDDLQTAPRETMLAFFQQRCRDLSQVSLYSEGDHSLWGCEREVSDELAIWLSRDEV